MTEQQAQSLLGETVDRWLKGRGDRREVAHSTVANYRQHLAHFVRHVGADRAMTEITIDDLEEWLATASNRKGRRYAPRTLNTMQSSVRSFFTWAAQRQVIPLDPTVGIARAKVPSRPPKRVPAEILGRVLALADFRTRTMIIMAAQLGLRRAEIAQLRIADWDQAAGTLIVIGKGDKARVLPVAGEVAEAMEVWIGSLPANSEWFWPSSHRPGAHLSHRRINDAIGEAGRAAGIDDLHPHRLRHTAASDLVEAGVDLGVVQRLLGHQSLQATSVYVTASAEHLREAVSQRRYGSTATPEQKRSERWAGYL